MPVFPRLRRLEPFQGATSFACEALVAVASGQPVRLEVPARVRIAAP